MGVWAGGARAPPKFYGRAKITAKFGQNVKISEKLCRKKNVCIFNCENDEKCFCYVGKNFVESRTYVRKKFFGYVRKKFFGDLWEKNINVK